MVKNVLLFPLLLLALSLSMVSCMNDDDDEVEIDEEWKALQEKYFNEAVAGKDYYELSSQSGNGKLLWKYSSEIDPVAEESKLRIAVDGKPEFTDTVMIRYEGWYFEEDGEKVIFDSSENISLKSRLRYIYENSSFPSPYPNKTLRIKFALNPNTASTIKGNFEVQGAFDGLSTVLQEMQIGEEREIVVPYQLAYGSYPYTYTVSSTQYILVPAYTTIRYRVKLMKIIPMEV